MKSQNKVLLFFTRLTIPLESFVDVEVECFDAFSDAIVQSYVNSIFKFPAVADAVGGQGVAPFEFVCFREDVPGTRPRGDTVAVVYFLTEFELCLHEVVVPVASLVVSSHAVRSAHQGDHAPRGVSVVEYALYLCGEDSPFPRFPVVPEVETGAFEGLVVAEEAGEELLFHLHEYSFVRVWYKISRVIRDDDTGPEGGDVLGCPVEERDVVEILRVHVAEHEVGAHVEVRCQSPEEFDLDLLLESLVGGAVLVVFPRLVADAPEFAGEGEEVHVGVEPEAVTREDAVVPDTQQVESRGGDVPVNGDVGGGDGLVLAVDAVEPGCHEPEPEFGVAREMRSPDDGEVETFLFFLFVGVREVAVEAMKEAVFHGCGVGNRRFLPERGE